HVYLDTIVLLGSLSANFNDQFSFGIGAIAASFLFFFSLGYMSKFLSNYIYSNKTWFWIDLTIGLLMISYGMYFIIF
ncbi:LysE family transporter, partial [Pelagibacteraceae bacterium]|nr:LysE family transporter [Pelagibacteraceae bacterium]